MSFLDIRSLRLDGRPAGYPTCGIYETSNKMYVGFYYKKRSKVYKREESAERWLARTIADRLAKAGYRECK